MTKEFAYFLGWAWGDGHFGKTNVHSKRFSIQILKSDANLIFPFFTHLFDCKIYSIQTQDRQPTKSLVSHDKFLRAFLEKTNFLNKSLSPPTKLLQEIPEDLHSYWFRGFFEADGCIYIGKQSTGNFLSCKVEFYGPINYDWEFLTKFLEKHEIKFKHTNRIRSSGNSSVISITKSRDVLLLGEILYPNKQLSLPRKRNKFFLFKKYKQCKEKQKFSINYLSKAGQPE